MQFSQYSGSPDGYMEIDTFSELQLERMEWQELREKEHLEAIDLNFDEKGLIKG